MRVCVLGSGSRGNSILVQAGESGLLVDAGFSARDLERRLASAGVDPASLEAIVITHEHQDHTRGMGIFARRHGTAIHITETTRLACDRLFRGGERIVPYRPGYPFEIGALRIEPFLTVHDASDPVAVAVVEVETGLRVGIATDLGRPTSQVRHALSGSDFLVLEANHDEAMLHAGPYPASVKARISSSHGHLSNRAAAALATELLHPRLAGVLLAHLSDRCNSPELARAVVQRALEKAGYTGYLGVALQDEPTELLDVEGLRAGLEEEQLSLL